MPRKAGRPASMTLEQYDPRLADLLVDQDQRDVAKGSSIELWWRCPEQIDDERHIYIARVNNKTSAKDPYACPICKGRVVVAGINDVATTNPEAARLLVDQSVATTHTKNSNKYAQFWCGNTQHQPWSAPIARVAGKQGSRCPQCSGRTSVTGSDDLRTTHPHLAAQLVDQTLARVLKAGSGPTWWRCDNPKHLPWQASVHARVNGSGCPTCSGRKVTLCVVEPTTHRREIDPLLVNMVRALVPDLEIRLNDRSTLSDRRELDIVIPERLLAIEFNGVYWHSEAEQSDHRYHERKSADASNAGLHLVHVWEDDWFDKREIVVRAIAHRLHATDNVLAALPDADPRIAQHHHARRLDVRRIDGPTARAFWAANHLQGPVACGRNIGLMDGETLVALLGVGRHNHGSRVDLGPGVWDVQRYTTLGVVTGGFTRLLKHAERSIRDDSLGIVAWSSFSDNDVSDGGMYKAAGFHVDAVQHASYSYVGQRTGWVRKHRSNYVRQRFIDDPNLVYKDGWTEHEAAIANGLYRVYDAGKTRWIKSLV